MLKPYKILASRILYVNESFNTGTILIVNSFFCMIDLCMVCEISEI